MHDIRCDTSEPGFSLFGLAYRHFDFLATVCKTVRRMLLDHCPVRLSVYNVGVLWPNGWMDQDETWHAGSPRPRPHCVRWVPAPLPPKGHSAPIFVP